MSMALPNEDTQGREQAREALRQAMRDMERSRRRTDETRDVARIIAAHRAENHFAQKLTAIIRGSQP